MKISIQMIGLWKLNDLLIDNMLYNEQERIIKLRNNCWAFISIQSGIVFTSFSYWLTHISNSKTLRPSGRGPSQDTTLRCFCKDAWNWYASDIILLTDKVWGFSVLTFTAKSASVGSGGFWDFGGFIIVWNSDQDILPSPSWSANLNISSISSSGTCKGML